MLGILRFIAFFVFTLTTMFFLVFVRIFSSNMGHILKLRRVYVRIVLWFLGIKITQTGDAPALPCIVVSNHRSYLDGILVLKDVLAMPIGKQEVASWPVIGWGARLSGIIFVDRAAKDSRSQARALATQALNKGYSVVVCPEGTTSDQAQTLPFRRGIFDVAAENGFAIVPLAIEYKTLSDAWVGSDTFVPHFLKSFSKPQTHIKIAYGAPLTNPDGLLLLHEAQQFIDAKLTVFQGEYGR